MKCLSSCFKVGMFTLIPMFEGQGFMLEGLYFMLEGRENMFEGLGFLPFEHRGFV